MHEARLHLGMDLFLSKKDILTHVFQALNKLLPFLIDSSNLSRRVFERPKKPAEQNRHKWEGGKNSFSCH